MGITLSKGQTISLTKTSSESLTKVRMGLGWDARQVRKLFGGFKDQEIDLDASCLVFDSAGQLIDQVWFNQLVSADRAITHTGDNRTGEGDGDDESIIVDLPNVNPAAAHLVFVVSSYTGESFSEIENAFCRLVDATRNDVELARYELSGSGAHTAQIMAKLSRDGGAWNMTAIGSTTNGRTILDLVPAGRAAL